MSDCLVIGGGVVGLSIAYELAGRGSSVTVVDRQQMGKEASWAGAGILPPANRSTAIDPLDQLLGLSYDLHQRWAQELQSETGIDNGYRRCGGIYLARRRGEAASLIGVANMLRELEIEISKIAEDDLVDLEPALASIVETKQLRAAYLLPGECQLRNPHHLQALEKACELRGVELRSEVTAKGFSTSENQIDGLQTDVGVLQADHYCVTAGPWTQQLLNDLGVETGILPVRGQMLLFQGEPQMLRRIINEGHRYLVPREDGHVLVGSTEEEEGFDKRTTDAGLQELADFALSLVPALKHAELKAHWAGLRPASFDGLPYLGRIPQLDNGYLAAGHFRSGIQLSTGTAVAMADLLRGETPCIDLSPFSVGRARQGLRRVES